MELFYAFLATALLTCSPSCAYSPNQNGRSRPNIILESSPVPAAVTAETHTSSRRQWLVAQLAATSVCTSFFHSDTAFADDNESPAGRSYSIEKCNTSTKAPCVSTANVRNLDLYLPPWTFDRSPDEVMSRLKGAIVADSNCQILQQEGSQYLKVAANRNDLFSTVDELEFVINDIDKVVFFRSKASNENKDFGANKKRLEEIRKRAGIFGVMGDSMMTADSASIDERGNGPLGQLKAFYGLQSGGGFEDVVLE